MLTEIKTPDFEMDQVSESVERCDMRGWSSFHRTLPEILARFTVQVMDPSKLVL